MEDKIAKQKLNVIVLVDCSKSMQGERIAQVNNALRDIKTHLIDLQGENSNVDFYMTVIGWTDAPKTCIGSATYTAKFREIAREYTVVFMNGDKVVASATYHYNDEIVYPLVTPVKAPDEQYSYVFAGWDKSDKAVTKDITFNAVFQEVLLEKTESSTNSDKNDKGCSNTLLSVTTPMMLLGAVAMAICKKRED